jgi:hypothetical protein
LAERFASLQRAALPEKEALRRQTAVLHELQTQMNTIGDSCPDDFRCANIVGLNSLQGLNIDHLSDDANDVNVCAGELLNRLMKVSPPPENQQVLFDQLTQIERESLNLDKELAAAASIAVRRMRGFDANLRQCREAVNLRRSPK